MSRVFPRRKNLRLQGFDYSTPGAYFVTICTQRHTRLFGEVVDGVMYPNAAGQMVELIWRSLPDKFPSAALDSFQVMPDHLHFGIWVAWPAVAPDITPNPSLIQMMQWFKSLTTARYRHGVKQEGWTRYPGKLWQRSYFDHIVRSQQALDKIRHYIDTDPARWQWDRYNAQRVGSDSLAVEIWRMIQQNEEQPASQMESNLDATGTQAPDEAKQ